MAEQKPEVGLRMSATLSDGNMQFRKVEVSLSMPTAIDDIDETYGSIKTWCEGNLDELIAEVQGKNPGIGAVTSSANSETDLDTDL